MDGRHDVNDLHSKRPPIIGDLRAQPESRRWASSCKLASDFGGQELLLGLRPEKISVGLLVGLLMQDTKVHMSNELYLLARSGLTKNIDQYLVAMPHPAVVPKASSLPRRQRPWAFIAILIINHTWPTLTMLRCRHFPRTSYVLTRKP